MFYIRRLVLSSLARRQSNAIEFAILGNLCTLIILLKLKLVQIIRNFTVHHVHVYEYTLLFDNLISSLVTVTSRILSGYSYNMRVMQRYPCITSDLAGRVSSRSESLGEVFVWCKTLHKIWQGG